ncbi:hypothetical protein E4U54_000663, partial [Claviceps lovelessii]
MSRIRQGASCAAVAVALAALMVGCCALGTSQSRGGMGVEGMSLEELDAELQTCPIVQQLNSLKHAHHTSQPSSVTTRLFAILFPGSPAVNALLATLYISGPPNFLLALCPTDIDPSSLSVMVAFAVGGLLGDTLFHLLPEIFLGEDADERARFVLVEPNRNLVLGCAILVGFMAFVGMDKGLRILTGGKGHDHGSGSGSPGASHGDDAVVVASGVEADAEGALRARKKKAKGGNDAAGVEKTKEVNPSVKLGGYLNLIADFTHNITDGLAMSASFYASPTIGATTTVAVFFHEIPHEVGDFALLVQSGFSKRAAMASQFVTAIGAFLGTLIGIAVQEMSGGGGGGEAGSEGFMPRNGGLWGTSL